MFHRTKRLFLRPAFPEDWEAIYKGVAEEAIVRNLARAPWPYSEEDARWFVNQGQDPHLPNFMLTLPGSDGAPLIGAAGFGRDDEGRIELGYWIARPWWGQGFASEAAAGVIAIARLLGFTRITAGHFTDNPASGAVLRRIGFNPTGVVAPRHSAGRGCLVDCAMYEWTADGGVIDSELRRAA